MNVKPKFAVDALVARLGAEFRVDDPRFAFGRGYTLDSHAPKGTLP